MSAKRYCICRLTREELQHVSTLRPLEPAGPISASMVARWYAYPHGIFRPHVIVALDSREHLQQRADLFGVHVKETPRLTIPLPGEQKTAEGRSVFASTLPSLLKSHLSLEELEEALGTAVPEGGFLVNVSQSALADCFELELEAAVPGLQCPFPTCGLGSQLLVDVVGDAANLLAIGVTAEGRSSSLFTCPLCGSHHFGSAAEAVKSLFGRLQTPRLVRHCHGRTSAGVACKFTFPESDDWRYFAIDSQRFKSRDTYRAAWKKAFGAELIGTMPRRRK